MGSRRNQNSLGSEPLLATIAGQTMFVSGLPAE